MDLSFLKRLMGGDEDLVNRFVSIFKAQVPDQIALLPQLSENKEWEELSTAIHSLKTQFDYVGLTNFAEQMRSMEEQVDGGETETMAQQIRHFTMDFGHFWESEFPAS